MAVSFYCEKCGKFVSIQAKPGARVKCPRCGKKQVVPETSEAAPTERTEDATPQAGREVPPTEAAQEQGPSLHPPIAESVGAALPWVISAFFHVGLALIMFFWTMIILDRPDEVTAPQAIYAERPSGPMAPADWGRAPSYASSP